MKKFERNPFNEKLIHRYLFETLYFGDKKTINSLLPREYQSKQINIIVPEKEYKKENYRSDLTVFFKGKKSGVPVEVKWNSNQKIGDNQINCLKKHGGILISFSKVSDLEVKYPKMKGYIKSIDHNNFIEWISNNITKLTKESLIYKAKIDELRNNNQKWLVVIFGKSHQKWVQLMNDKNKIDDWCFRKTEIILKRMFDIQRGDDCLFILGSIKGGNMKIKSNQNSRFQYSGWALAKINEPYYMDVNNTRFEDNTGLNEGDLVWPHFFNFKIDKTKEYSHFWLGKKTSDKKGNFGRNLETIDFGKRGELDYYICESVNNGLGSPVSIPNGIFETLIDKLRSQTLQKK